MKIVRSAISIVLAVMLVFLEIGISSYAEEVSSDTSAVSQEEQVQEEKEELEEPDQGVTVPPAQEENSTGGGETEAEIVQEEIESFPAEQSQEVETAVSRAAGTLGVTASWSAIQCGTPTTFTLNASGGTGPYKYRLHSIYDFTGWMVYDVSWPDNFPPGNISLGTYRDSNQIEFTFYASGPYRIQFEVMDMGAVGVEGATVTRRSQEYYLNISDPKFPSVEQKVEQLVTECKKTCSTDFEKALWLHDWIVDNADYDNNYRYCAAEGVLARGIGTCESYHRAYVMLLNKAGINTGRITGNGHVWTAVQMDGKWYQVDSTWDGNASYKSTYKKHLYFGLTDELIELAHPEHKTATAGYESNSLENNYFIKTGDIKQWSEPFEKDVKQNILDGKTEFALAIPGNMYDTYDTDILYHLVAYQLSKQDWDGSKVSAVYTKKSSSDRHISFKVTSAKPDPTPDPKPEVTANKLEIQKNKTESTITVRLTNASVSGNDQVQFPVWGAAGGQNDIVWYPARKVSTGTYEAQIPISAHKETGKYNIHVYVKHNNTLKYLTGGGITITGITADKVSCNESKSSVKDGKYRIEVENLKSPAAIQTVQMAVWSDVNGQDDIKWYTAKQDGNKWYVNVEAKNHKYNTGTYHAHVYAADSRGIRQCAKTTKFTVGKMDINRLKIQKNAAESVITVTLSNATVSGNAQVQFPVWGAAGGQNDIVWYTGKKVSTGTYEAQIPISSHKETGKYNIHVYSKHNGASQFLAAGTVNITGISAKEVSLNAGKSSTKDGKYRLEAKNVTSPSSVKKVRIAVWSSKNGQDDIRWYEMKKSGDIWYADADACYHKYDSGTYLAHAYAEDSRGISQFIGSVNFNVEKIKRNQLQVSMDKEQRYMTILLKAASTNGTVSFPVWGEAGGQNDIVWYNGTRTAPYTYKAVVDVSKHKETGTYRVHTYASANGNLSYLAGGSVKVEGITGGKLEAVVNRDTASVNVKISGITGPSAITKVSVAVWTTAKGQDDLRWYEAGKQKDGWSFQVDTAKHNLETGTYNIHAYATDKRGIQAFAGGVTTVVNKADSVKFSAKLASNGTDVDIVGTGIRGARDVRVAVWGKKNGQNDLRWYSMSRSIGTKYQKRVNLYDHGETGTYYCHVYITGVDGVLRFAGATEFTVDKLSTNNLKISSINNTVGKCSASLYFPKTKKEISGIQMAVWTQENGQDDLYWYHATRINNVWTAPVDSLNHKCRSGLYFIHVYASTIDGNMEFLTGSTFRMSRTDSIDIASVIKNAGKPLGKTLYVWGGGWNAADNGSGETAVNIGLWPEWENYFNRNRQGYSYRPGQSAWRRGERQWRFYGLDCSGYLGWMLYNSVHKGRNASGYVVDAEQIASSLTAYGYGTVTACSPSSTFKPGDIISISGHCYLVLGQCSDRSVLLIHSTPNGGVQVSGTVNGGSSSQASRLAQSFMQQNYPAWWASFGGEGRQSVSASAYLNGRKFSWTVNGQVGDSAGMQNKSPEQVLNYL